MSKVHGSKAHCKQMISLRGQSRCFKRTQVSFHLMPSLGWDDTYTKPTRDSDQEPTPGLLLPRPRGAVWKTEYMHFSRAELRAAASQPVHFGYLFQEVEEMSGLLQLANFAVKATWPSRSRKREKWELWCTRRDHRYSAQGLVYLLKEKAVWKPILRCIIFTYFSLKRHSRVKI